MREGRNIRWKQIVTYIAGTVAILGFAAISESILGRKLWGVAGEPGLWSGDVNSLHNSQYATDPYVFSHITHGILLYALIWMLARRRSVVARALMVSAVEASWEIIENTNFVIERYRAATISLHYYGDSIVNSLFDVVACILGFWIAWTLPARYAIATVVILEVGLAFWIRDGLFLNILMLIYPIRAVKAWQAGG